MAYHFGKSGYVAMALQDTEGTAETTLDIGVPVEQMPSLKATVEKKYNKEYRKTTAEDTGFSIQKISAAGDLVLSAYCGSGLEHMLYGVFGTKEVARDGTTLAYDKTFKIGNTLPMFTAGIGRNTLNMEKFKDLRVGKIGLSFAPDEDVKMTANVQGRPAGIGSAAITPSYGTERAFTFEDIGVSLGGSPNCDILNVDLNIDRGLKSLRTACASAGRGDNAIYPTTCAVDGSIEMFFQDYTEYAYWLGGSGASDFTYDATPDTMKRALVITATGQTIDTNKKDTLVFTVPKIVYDDATIDMPYDDRMKVKFDFKALWDGTQAAGEEVIKASVKSLMTDITSPA